MLQAVSTARLLCIPCLTHSVRVKASPYFACAARATRISAHPSKHETLTQCWSNAGPFVCDAGRASNQHCFNASCLLGLVRHNFRDSPGIPVARHVTCFETCLNPRLSSACHIGRLSCLWLVLVFLF